MNNNTLPIHIQHDDNINIIRVFDFSVCDAKKKKKEELSC